ncbi:MAG: S8 family serine peptidase [Candidatus Sumerlaeaceae bacterium]
MCFHRFLAVTILTTLAGMVIAAPPSEKLNKTADGKPELAKLSHSLLKARQHAKSGMPGLAAMQKEAKHAQRGNKTQCILGVKSINDDLLMAISGQGLEIVNKVSFDGNLNNIVVRATDPRQFDAIASRADILGITEEPEARCHSVGSADNQADRAINCNDARSTYSITGSGTRVGVISDSFSDTRGGTIVAGILTGNTDQVSGDLPASIRIIDAGPVAANSDEGNAMAQLVYDIAPGCDIAFASAFSSYAAFATNITALRTHATNPSHVIVDDVAYFAEPMYQDGPIAQAADLCGINNVPYFSSAANYGSSAHEAVFADFNVTDDTAGLPSGNDLHVFGGGDRFLTLNVSAAGGSVLAILHWDEPYAGSLGAGLGAEADLDLHLVNSTALPVASAVASSNSFQGTLGSPSGEPYEIISASGLAAGTYHLIIEHYQGREPVNMNLIVSPGTNTSVTDTGFLGARTIYGHNSAANVIAVGAINYFEWEPSARLLGAAGNTPGTYQDAVGTIDVENFSSRGGNLPFWFSSDGLTRFGSAVTRFKPEITAPDGCDTTFFGSGDFDGSGKPNFFGTSAAAPNAAAVAALVRHRFTLTGRSTTSTNIYNTMKNNVLAAKSGKNVESAGTDNDSGLGVIDAEAAALPVSLSAYELE